MRGSLGKKFNLKFNFLLLSSFKDALKLNILHFRESIRTSEASLSVALYFYIFSFLSLCHSDLCGPRQGAKHICKNAKHNQLLTVQRNKSREVKAGEQRWEARKTRKSLMEVYANANGTASPFPPGAA